MNRDDDNPARNQPDASGTRAGGGAGRNGGEDGDDDDDRRGHGRRRHHHYPRYHQDDTQLYGTSGGGGGARTQGGGRTQSSRLQDECDRGYEDGLRSGEKDARKGLSSDPQRWTLYRMGGETPSRTGRPGDARLAYRDCFLRGYEEGYRNIRPTSGGTSPLD